MASLKLDCEGGARSRSHGDHTDLDPEVGPNLKGQEHNDRPLLIFELLMLPLKIIYLCMLVVPHHLF